MTLSTKLAVAALGAAGLLAIPLAAAAQPRYKVRDLGTLGGVGSFSEGLNDAGQTVGWSVLESGVAPRPFLYDHGIADLGSGPSHQGRALAINNQGQVVGDATSTDSSPFTAFLYENGVMTDLSTLGGLSSQALGINDGGQAVGWSEFVPPPVWPEIGPVDQRHHAFLYDGSVMHDLHDLAALDGEVSVASDINDFGYAIGYFETGALDGNGSPVRHGFLYQGSTALDLGTFGGVSGIPLRLNNLGQIVGIAIDANGEASAFSLAEAVLTALGALGGTQSVARDVNDLGAIVGQATTGDVTTFDTPVWHAFLHENGAMVDLNELIPEDSEWVLTDASGINAYGQIVGTGKLNGETRAYLLTLVPEPTSATLTVLALLMIGRFRPRRAGGRRSRGHIDGD